MKQKTLFFIAAAALLAACGKIEDVYYDVENRIEIPRGLPIADADELARIGVDDGYPLDGDYYLAEDIDLSGHKPWTPIGKDAAAPFSGVFNGNGKTVSGLSLSSEGDYAGLFGYILTARLIDLTIELDDTTVVLASTTAQYAGAAAGYIKSSYIYDITIRTAEGAALYAVKAGTGDFYAGGLAGRLEESSVTNITVNLELKATSGAILYAGLVAGESALGTFSSCYAEGAVEALSAAGALYAGGIVGSHTTALEDCVSAVTRVYAENGGGTTITRVGGIAGYSADNGNIFTSSLKAGHDVVIQGRSTTTATTSSNYYVAAGGISGGSAATIDRCVVDAPVSVIAVSDNPWFLYAGGITGRGMMVSNSSVRRGEVRAETDAEGTSATIVALAAGGIAGDLANATYKITGCFSAANVTVNSHLKASLDTNVVTAAGGVVGVTQNGPAIEKSGASGKVSVTASSSEPGFAFAGGILGFGTSSSGGAAASISQCAALNESVTVETGAATPYAWRILGCAATYSYPNFTLITPDDMPNKSLSLYGNYGLPDMEVRTKQPPGDDWLVVPQTENDTQNLMGSGNMERTQAFFESRLGWNFDTDWYWDAETDTPFPRQ